MSASQVPAASTGEDELMQSAPQSPTGPGPSGPGPSGSSGTQQLAPRPRDDSLAIATQFAKLVNRPDEFTGDRGKTRAFIHQMRLFFNSNRWMFENNEERKINFALNQLRGTAAEWSEPLVALMNTGKTPQS
ncbi:hypothetical protein TWF730_005080 [Orbilia blumenaviensis]|uniref:DUF4939 domain-containing protein n=1 Tax=Orbilia blumenaviensis TaxID=1796055 RepID=A0AAV9VH80_9PEZI